MMRVLFRFLFIFALSNFELRFSSAQQNFLDCDFSRAGECVTDYVANRELFRDYVCAGQISREILPLHPKIQESILLTKFVLAERADKHLLRRDWQVFNILGNQETEPHWRQEFQSPKGNVYFIGKSEYSFAMGIEAEHFVPDDIWALSFADSSNIEARAISALWWLRIFDDEKLLAVQESSSIIRAEWSVGPEARIQAYFDSKKGNMPVFCRYVVPVNPEERFSKKSRINENEITTDWTKFGQGWVPVHIHNWLDISMDSRPPIASKCLTIDIDWESKIKIDDDLFKPKAVSSSAFFNTFSKIQRLFESSISPE